MWGCDKGYICGVETRGIYVGLRQGVYMWGCDKGGHLFRGASGDTGGAEGALVGARRRTIIS